MCHISCLRRISLSPDSIFSIIFSFLFKGIQSSTAYNDLMLCPLVEKIESIKLWLCIILHGLSQSLPVVSVVKQ